jgi:hypothetical protein
MVPPTAIPRQRPESLRGYARLRFKVAEYLDLAVFAAADLLEAIAGRLRSRGEPQSCTFRIS